MSYIADDLWLNSRVVDESCLSVSQAISDLVSHAPVYGIELSDKQASDLMRELQILLEKNKGVNLTSIRDPEKAIVLHLLDSLIFKSVIDEASAFSLDSSFILDMGTGGGFPGIPLALVSSGSYVLVDSVNKKVAACSEFAEELSISNRVECKHGRLEELAKDSSLKSKFDIVVARALASLDVLIEYATPFLKMNGVLVLSKGNPSDDEVASARRVANLCGLTFVSRETFELPDEYGHREFYVYKKVSKAKVKLPRKNGEARRNPLASSC